MTRGGAFAGLRAVIAGAVPAARRTPLRPVHGVRLYDADGRLRDGGPGPEATALEAAAERLIAAAAGAPRA